MSNLSQDFFDSLRLYHCIIHAVDRPLDQALDPFPVWLLACDVIPKAASQLDMMYGRRHGSVALRRTAGDSIDAIDILRKVNINVLICYADRSAK